MFDDTDLSQEKQWFSEERAKTAVANFQKRNMNAWYVPDRQEALSLILGMIPEGAVVARGDSVTLEQVGIIAELKKRGKNSLIYPLELDENGQFVAKGAERWQIAREAIFADIYLTGANAVTLDGKLVNTDGWGNRVYPMLFGPPMVIVVAGVNKIVQDVNEGLERIRTIAAPVNVRRHFIKHQRPDFGELPCAKIGRCVDCRHEMRICNYTVIIEGTLGRQKGRLNVVLVGEELGI